MEKVILRGEMYYADLSPIQSNMVMDICFRNL